MKNKIGLVVVMFIALLLLPIGSASPQDTLEVSQQEALRSAMAFIQEHIKFEHRDIPLTSYSILAREPLLTEQGWELLVRVQARIADKTIQRDLLLYIEPTSHRVTRVYASKTGMLEASAL